MNDGLVRREAARPRRASAAAELGANANPQYGEVIEVHPPRESQPGSDRLAAAAGRMERRNSASQLVHQRHMPMEPLKFHIPRKTKENRALFQYVSTESREYEDMMTIFTFSYVDTSSAGCFTYSQPRLIHSELLEKEFVEKRREMKADGRTDKELEESYCFLLADAVKLHPLCEKGLSVGQSWITVLGNPGKGVYLSRYSDLLQINALTPGTTGEIIIFKVMKGKVKSIYENMKNLLDPTPRFDSHISKNASKVTSLTSYRAFELTQQYFYEYSFDELRERPRHVCPYAVVSFHFKGKDSTLPSKPLALIRSNSQSAEGSKERVQYTVWTGDLVKGDRVLFQISLRSFSPPFLPHRLPEKLDIGCLMRLDQVTKLIPSELLSYNLYNGNQEVVMNGYCCSLLEVIDRCRPTTSVTRLLHELEMKRVVLVTRLTEKGFLLLLSSVQMATPTERGESWRRCLQALFVFPETRDVARSAQRCASSSHDAPQVSGVTVMPRLKQFIPALHYALVKMRANPPPELSAGVEHQVREYLTGLNDGKVRHYPMGEYDSTLDEQEKMFPAPRHHRVNMDSYVRSYLYNPTVYLLSVARVKQSMEGYCGFEEPQEMRPRCQSEAAGKTVCGNTREGQSNSEKLQQLMDSVLTCKRNAENEVKREERGDGGLRAPGRKRRLEQETAERTLKYLKASQDSGRQERIPVKGSQVSGPPDPLASVIRSLGLRDIDLSEDGSELAARLLSLLTGLNLAAKGTAGQSPSDGQEHRQRELSPFDQLATKLGLPTNCDIDLRKQDELEEQMAGSMSSLEGFSPSSHSGDTNHHGASKGGGGRGGLGRRAGGYDEEDEEQWQIPWVLIPITGLCSERYTHRDRNIPQDPRFQHLTMATSITTSTETPRRSPTPSPQPSSPPSPSQCLSPDPSPPPSPSHCPSPEPSPPASPLPCRSPGPSPPTFPSQCPSPQPSPPTSPSQCPSPPSPFHCQSPKPDDLKALNKNHSGVNKELLAPTVSREFTVKPQGKEKKNEEPSVPASPHPFRSPAPGRRTGHSPPPTERGKETALGESGMVEDVQGKPLVKLKEGEDAKGVKQNEEEVVHIRHDAAGEKEQRGQAKNPVGSSVFPSSDSSPPLCVRDIDTIVDKHLVDLSSEIQLLLQEQDIHYNFPQSPHSTSNTETTEQQHILPHSSIAQFSQYVSFYNPCPPVQDYIHSLQNSINGMLTEFERWPGRSADTGQISTDAALASSVSAFVAGIRAGTTDRDEEVSASSELMTADVSASISRSPVAWQPETATKHFPAATSSRNPPTSEVTLSVSTSMPGPACSTAKLYPSHAISQQSHWEPQQSHTLEIKRTVTQNVRQTQDNSSMRTVHRASGVETGSTTAGSNSEMTLPVFSVASNHSAELPQSTEPVSSSASVCVSGTHSGPPPEALSSLISQLQPEVFSNLVEIIKDVRRNSLQFYLHKTEPEDHFYEDVRDHLLKQGNTEQNPVSFLNQEKSDNKLLVIIKNKDIAGHIHKIPGLVSLKRHPSVVFVGIDTVDDIRNNSYIELFVSGGCIVSDELVLNPDFITHDRLAALLMFLEEHSSPESVWKWKVHCKTHKKLKEQARSRRDAANLLDVLSAYQKRQIVEFLPYHYCDMMEHKSPDMNCLIELQGRYTQYRHTVFLTEHHFEVFAAYAGSGFIVANIDEFLHDFTRLVGYHDIKDKQPIMDDLLTPKGLSRQLSHSDSVSGSERSPSIFPEHTHTMSSCEQPRHPGSALLSLPHLSDQLVPDASCKDAVLQHSDTEFEVLRQAISHFRAKRQAQLQQQQLLDSRADCSINSLLANPVSVGTGHATPPLDPGGSTESVRLTPGRKAVSDTLELIHSALQPERGDQERRERQRTAGETEDQRGGTPVLDILSGSCGTSKSDASPPSSSENTAVVTGPSNQPDSTSDGTEKVHQHGEPALPNTLNHGAASSSTSSCPAVGDRPRSLHKDAHLGQEQPIRAEQTPPGNTTTSGAKLTGSITPVTDQNDNKNPAPPRLRQVNNHQQQQVHEYLLPRHSQPQHPLPPPQQQQWGVGLLQPPNLARLPGQPFSSGHVLGPLAALGGIRTLLGPTPVWTRRLAHPGAATWVWGFPQAGTSASLLGGYHNPAGRGSSRYRGGQRGGGYNGM